MPEQQLLSTANVSQALGVGVTTIKRWVDEGVLPAYKTAGGHRRIALADVMRLVREGHFPRLDLARLNLPDVGGGDAAPEDLSGRLRVALREGDGATIRGLIHGCYAAGMAIEEMTDAVIAPAMHGLGHDWETGRIDVFHEHRGTMLVMAALHELKPAVEANADKDRPVALGGNPEGELHALASQLIQLTLLDAGWDPVNLGAHTPLASLRRALHELRPRLLWLSATHLPSPPDRFLAEYRELYREAERLGTAVAVGGQALSGCVRALMPYTTFGDGLSHLAAFARTLHPRPRPPRRGRPARPSY